MAAMGERTMSHTATKAPDPRPCFGELMPFNLVGQIIVQPTATFTVEPCALGAPIMREGFITETGFLLTPRQGGL